jgi:hypothetical protein
MQAVFPGRRSSCIGCRVDLSEAFRHNPDGSWSCVAPVTLDHPRGRIQITPGSTFFRGRDFMGIDVAEWLDLKYLDTK